MTSPAKTARFPLSVAGEAMLEGPHGTWRLAGNGSTVSCEAPPKASLRALRRTPLPHNLPLNRIDRLLRRTDLRLEVRRGARPLAFVGCERPRERRFAALSRLLDRFARCAPLRPAWFGVPSRQGR